MKTHVKKSLVFLTKEFLTKILRTFSIRLMQDHSCVLGIIDARKQILQSATW